MKLLVVLDLSEPTELIVTKAEQLAKAMSAQVWILHNAEPESDDLEFRTDPKAARDTLAQRFRSEHRQIQAIAETIAQTRPGRNGAPCARANGRDNS